MRLIQSLFFALTILIFSSTVKGQSHYYTLKGQIIDQLTGQPMGAASVVAQNTTVGTLSDSSGFFRIRLPEGGYTLAVSYTGYQTEIVRVTQQMASEDLMITLAPETKSLEEVAVILDLEVKNGWEKYGQFFINNFIGQTNFSKACIIKNPEALHFYYFRRRNTLKITAKEPLIVENFALGYTLKFAIDSFTNNYTTRTSMFIGYPVFEEMVGTPEQESLWARNRLSIYNGSMLHFMRTLYSKRLFQEGFELKFIFKTPAEEIPIAVKDPYSALNFQNDSLGIVHIKPFQPEVAVIYHRDRPEVDYLLFDPTTNKNFQISTLVFDSEDSTYIERNGYYYPQEEIITNGYLGFKKIGDMLPYDYQPFPEEN